MIKKKAADNLRWLTVIVLLGTMIVPTLLNGAPVFAAPDQGDGYWTDTFSDPTDINASASTNISVSGGDVKLGLKNVSSVAFNDSFETDLK